MRPLSRASRSTFGHPKRHEAGLSHRLSDRKTRCHYPIKLSLTPELPRIGVVA